MHVLLYAGYTNAQGLRCRSARCKPLLNTASVVCTLQLTCGTVSAGTPRTMASWGCLPQQGSNTRTMNPAQSQALLPARPAHASRRAGRQGTVQTSAQSVRPQVRAQLKRRVLAVGLLGTADNARIPSSCCTTHAHRLYSVPQLRMLA